MSKGFPTSHRYISFTSNLGSGTVYYCTAFFHSIYRSTNYFFLNNQLQLILLHRFSSLILIRNVCVLPYSYTCKYIVTMPTKWTVDIWFLVLYFCLFSSLGEHAVSYLVDVLCQSSSRSCFAKDLYLKSMMIN
jgi:hypothetical protein